ncbi:MAG: TAXI family TRAP transporter solute-binding subunit, partial [Rhizobiales bacterium]|nr:TAXI family TRAP transporter solute-binding subunit [Hyphomicrobiales bacterium]
MKNSIKMFGLGLGLALAIAGPATAAEIKMMTGPQGGSWIPLGGQLKDMWEKAVPGLAVQVMPGAGIANARGVDEGKADVGFGNSISTVDGIHGKPPFTKAATNICNLATLYPQYYQFIVNADSGVEKFEDLKGKSLTTQQRGNTGELITRQILGVHGLKYEDVKISFVGYSDSVNQMKDGHAVAFALGTQIPAGAVMDLAAARDIHMFDQAEIYDKMLKLNPSYKLITLPKGTYPKQDKNLQIIGFFTHIVASCKLPPDAVYTMTKTIATNTKTLATVAKDIATLKPAGM